MVVFVVAVLVVVLLVAPPPKENPPEVPEKGLFAGGCEKEKDADRPKVEPVDAAGVEPNIVAAIRKQPINCCGVCGLRRGWWCVMTLRRNKWRERKSIMRMRSKNKTSFLPDF